ncbi:MAG: T9SS type A sorting domain-containing protein [Bacteroidetes bacterium]|nr:T9SS type A sorting domain-containing protein [Bacteroidota bacterium]
MKKSILLFLTLFISITITHAQEVIPATGGNATGSGGSVSYTIGQIVYSTNSGTTGSVAEGVQQPYEISETSIKETTKNNPGITVFPNPTTDNLTLKVSASTPLSNQITDYRLYDISGKLLETKKLTNNETIISTANLPSGTYFLKVVSDDKEIKTFKIVKNH